MNIHDLLEQVKKEQITIEEAEKYLKKLPYEDLEFAKLDHHRKLRSGFGEVIFCKGKETRYLIEIFRKFIEKGENVLGTKATKEQYQAVKEVIPSIEYDNIAKIICYQKEVKEKIGHIVVCTAGTSDIGVAEEAAKTAEFFGSYVERIYDIGVAGIHRLFSKIEQIRKANCIIAIAGMEGALGSVITGLVEKPVIGVPTSIGYGASFGGIAPLLTMLNSCAEGMAVVNIDNGFGAGYLATQINRMAV